MQTPLDTFWGHAKHILKGKIYEDSIPEDEQEDILRSCLSDIISKYPYGKLPDKIPIEIIEQIIDANLSKYIAQIVAPEGSIDIVDDEEEHLVSYDFPENIDTDNLTKENLDRFYNDNYTFHQILREPATILLYDDIRSISKKESQISDIVVVNTELINYLKRHPTLLYNLDPIKFEELVAEILRDIGYTIELTKQTRDGGIDIFATQKTGIGESLLVVDCKRYMPDKHIGVGVVRSLYGVMEELKATQGMIATTSYFSKPAKEFQKRLKYRMLLNDFNDIVAWLNSFGKPDR